MIYVVGDVMLDVEMEVQPRENYEGATACMIGTKRAYYPGGAANVAVLLQRLGHNVSLFGLVGSDWAAEELYNLLGDIEVHCLALLPVTTVKTRIYDSEIMMRVDCENHKPDTWAVEECLREFQQFRPACVVFSDYGKGVFGSLVRAAVQRIVKHEPTIPTVVDPKPCQHNDIYADVWNGCTVAIPSAREMDEMALNVQNLVVTHGSGGVVLTSESGTVAIPCREIDNPHVVGAGDALTAGMASSLAQGNDVMSATEFAVEFATDYVSQPRAEAYRRREYAASQ